ncbi:MAG TPA: MJ0042-type zinc finger domain-containing protein [Pseudolabrys sp.]
MVSDPLTDGCYVDRRMPLKAMLIACPNCSTSYMIDPASLGEAGRTVRCARCRTTWFAATPETANASTDAAVETSVGVIRPDQTQQNEREDSASESQQTAEAAGEQNIESTQAPITVSDAPPIVPQEEPPPTSETATEGDELENFAARRKRLQARRKKERRSSRWTALILVLFAFNVALIGARSEVVRFFPQTASLFSAVGLPVNLRHLKFENMRVSRETQEGLSALIIEGTIVNIVGKPTEVPRLRFAARDASGQEVYTWSALPGRSILGPGEKLDFRSRFVSPPPNATDVMVRFFTPQDSQTAAK